MVKKIALILAITLVVVGTTSCMKSDPKMGAGKQAEIDKKWDEAVVAYGKVLEQNPGNVEARIRLESVRRKASKEHLAKARELWQAGRLEQAILEYRTARDLDPLNRPAILEFNERMRELKQMEQDQLLKEEAAEMAATEAQAKALEESQRPVADVDSEQETSFYFPNRNVGDIYQALAKLAGINVIYHESVRQALRQKTDFIINNATYWEAFDYFVNSNNHFYRLIKDDTIMIIEGSRQNRQSYEELVVKVFYLSNAEVRDVQLALRMLAQGAKISSLRNQNAVVVRDTPQRVAIISRLIDVLDKPKAEVIIDIEFLEVSSSVINDTGILLSAYSSTQTFVNPNITETDAASNIIPMDGFDLIKRENLFLTIPNLVYNFLKTNSNSKLLAKPQLRITDGEKSELHIGAEVPVRSSTFNPGSAAGVGTPVDSFEYRPTGIKFIMTPRVHNNGEVTLEMEIEISAIGAGADSTNPTFTTRKVKSKVRLDDGETNMLAGLIREEEKYDLEGVAGLADIPLLGRLFRKDRMDEGKTDIIITITPHIIRGGRLSMEDLMAIKYGSEANPGFGGLISMKELEAMRYLRGIPLKGGAIGGGSSGSSDFGDAEDEYYYYYEEQYYEEEDEEDDDPPRF